MKRITLVLTLFGLGFGSIALAQQPALQIVTDTTKTATSDDHRYFGNVGEKVQITIKTAQATDLRLVHKIPKGLTDIRTQPLPGNCSLIKRLSSPTLILCLGLDEATEISYTATLPSQASARLSGFTATKSTMSTTGQRWFFERLILTVRKPVSSPTPTSKPATPTPAASLTPTPLPDNPADISRHPRTLADPESRIIPDATKGAIVASAFFEPQNEAIIIKELTVTLTPYNTAALFGDVANDLDVVNAVSLFYQDGTPIKRADGRPAQTGAITANGKARFTNLDFAIPEGGERLFVAIDTNELIAGQSGSAFTAAFSFAPGDADIRGFWSGAQLEGEIGADKQKSPAQIVLANRLTVSAGDDQNEILLSGRNRLLDMVFDVEGGDEVFLEEVTAQLTKSASGDGFRVTRLRLRQGGDILASKTGADLTGTQTLRIGVCAAGDSCTPSSNDAQSIFRETTITLEAEIAPENGSLEGSNALSASIEINGSAPGQDDISWRDYGNYGDDGVSIRWIDLGSSSVTRLENTLRNP